MITIPPINRTFGDALQPFRLVTPEICIEPHKLVFVMGPNGGGKSLFLLSVCEAIERDTHTQNLRATIVYQDPKKNVALSATPLENLVAWRKFSTLRQTLNPKSAVKSEIPKLDLAFPSLAGRWNQDTSTLSGGQQQSLAIACRFQSDSRLLLFDEITSSIDQNNSLTLMESVKKNVTDGNSYCICVSHDISEAEKFADRVLFFANGNIAFDLKNDISLSEISEKSTASWQLQYNSKSRPT